MNGKVLAQAIGYISVVEKGEKGATERFREWEDIPEGESLQSGADGDTYIDYVVYQEDWYVCILTHYKNSQQYKPNNGTFWQKVSEQSRIATKLLLATKGFVKNLQVDEVIITDQGEGKGNILLRATKEGIECKSGNFENINASGVFRSKDDKTWNEIEMNAKKGYFVMRGPSVVSDDNQKLPGENASLIDIFKLEFDVDADTLARIVRISMNNGNDSGITIDSYTGIRITDAGASILLDARGVHYEGQWAEWSDIIKKINS